MKSVKKFEEVPKFNDKQIEKQLAKQIRFLKLVYPFLEDDIYQEGCLELRPVRRNKETKYVRSYNAWRMDEKAIDKLRDFLKKINGQPCCLYYSLYTLRHEKKKEGKINKNNCLFTSVLAADFDKITQEEFQKEKKKLTDLGIETIDIFTGHGFQMLILLKEKVYDKELVRKFTNLLVSKGFRVDSTIIDCARLFRMPYSFNCKSLDKSSEYYDQGIIPATVINFSDKRYYLVDVFKKINSLPDVIKPTETQAAEFTELSIKSLKVAPITVKDKQEQIKKIKEVKKIKIENLNSVYGDYIQVDRLPEAIQKMLNGSEEGLRNQVMLFIVPFLRNTLGLNIQTIKSILTIWGDLCSPQLDKKFIEKEVDRIYKYGFKGRQGKYTKELQKAYGYLEFSKYTRANKIIIPNAIFEDFDIISDGSVKIYLGMKLAEQIEGLKEFTQKEIEEVSKISRRTFFRNINDLLVTGFICKRKANRRQGEEYIYYINPYFNSTKGFTPIENILVKSMLLELTDGEMKLYSYLCHMIGSCKHDCWASQKYIASKIGKKQNSVSEMTSKLSEKKYITKRIITRDNIKHCIYNLNY